MTKREKVTFRKFSTESEHLSKIGEKSETGEKMHHGLRGVYASGGIRPMMGATGPQCRFPEATPVTYKPKQTYRFNQSIFGCLV